MAPASPEHAVLALAPAIARDIVGYVITSELCLLWLRLGCLYAVPSHDFRYGAAVFTSKSFFPRSTSRLQAPTFTVFSIEIIPRLSFHYATRACKVATASAPVLHVVTVLMYSLLAFTNVGTSPKRAVISLS